MEELSFLYRLEHTTLSNLPLWMILDKGFRTVDAPLKVDLEIYCPPPTSSPEFERRFENDLETLGELVYKFKHMGNEVNVVRIDCVYGGLLARWSQEGIQFEKDIQPGVKSIRYSWYYLEE